MYGCVAKGSSFSVHHKFSIFEIKYVKKGKNVIFLSHCVLLSLTVYKTLWHGYWCTRTMTQKGRYRENHAHAEDSFRAFAVSTAFEMMSLCYLAACVSSEDMPDNSPQFVLRNGSNFVSDILFEFLKWLRGIRVNLVFSDNTLHTWSFLIQCWCSCTKFLNYRLFHI